MVVRLGDFGLATRLSFANEKKRFVGHQTILHRKYLMASVATVFKLMYGRLA